ncbi:helix-turn-helix domain-containing protein [Nibribacter koreensis]|uniref:Helix-turn-helix domain-containing protein n=1 Tax=Nibribacter koreensis TaxID=1084519 RepID=A0ABP8F5N4_9BACT
MQEIRLIQLQTQELRMIVREELRRVLSETGLLKAIGLHEELLTIEQAAQMLGLAKSTIYVLTSRQEIPCFKKSRRLYFRRSELLTWVEAGRRKPDGKETVSPSNSHSDE